MHDEDFEDEGPVPCWQCGATETTELHHDGPNEFSVTICAGCGSDE